MDRIINYPGAIPLAEDELSRGRFAQRANALALSTIFGSNVTVADNFHCDPTSPASLAVIVGPGSLITPAATDPSAFGLLPADATSILKQGDLPTATTFPLTAPGSPGTTVNYLVQVTFAEVDDTSLVLPYYNAANPTVGFSGPGNSGNAQNTVRRQRAVLSIKPGAAAGSGTQATPAADTGYWPLWIVSVAYGQTTVTASSIKVHPAAPYIGFQLPLLTPGFSRMQVFSSSTTWIVPFAVRRVNVTMWGGGGGGGGCVGSYSGGGGGGGGGYREGIFDVTPGDSIPVTIAQGGPGGAAGANTGQPGGITSFGGYLSATGGAPGFGANGGPSLGGAGGTGFGGSLGIPGCPGGNALSLGGPNLSGNGGGSFGVSSTEVGNSNNGGNGNYPGGGGQGAANGTFAGGSGQPGLCIVRY